MTFREQQVGKERDTIRTPDGIFGIARTQSHLFPSFRFLLSRRLRGGKQVCLCCTIVTSENSPPSTAVGKGGGVVSQATPDTFPPMFSILIRSDPELGIESGIIFWDPNPAFLTL